MATPNIYEEMKKALTDFKGFLRSDGTIAAIKAAVQALAAMIPQINELITQLSNVLGQIKTKISSLDVTNIPGLDKISTFTKSIITLLDASKTLVPDLESEINTVLGTAGVVTSLPSLEQLKTEILGLLTDIIDDVNSFKSA